MGKCVEKMVFNTCINKRNELILNMISIMVKVKKRWNC